LSDLKNAYMGIDQVWGRDGCQLHERLIEASSIAGRLT
jgi:hypothetical protein